MSIDFDGTNDYAEIADNAVLDVGASGRFMIGLYFCADTYPADWTHIISKWDESGNKGYAVRWMTDGAGKGKVEFRMDSAGEYAVERTGLSSGVWHWLVVGRLNSVATWRLYYATGISSGGYVSGSNGDLSNSVPMRMGSRSWNDPDEFFNGKIGQVIFAKDITTGWAGANYDWDRLVGFGGGLIRTICRPQSGKTQLYLPMNEPAGITTIYDRANRLSCSLNNGAVLIPRAYNSYTTVYPKWFS